MLLPQRYVFSSKSQHEEARGKKIASCCCYHKGTYFQANHNMKKPEVRKLLVVVATTKVRIFKQITTLGIYDSYLSKLLLLPQRYVFSSKSQLLHLVHAFLVCCCCYHKGTYFQANHNTRLCVETDYTVVVATTKVRIFKQITTPVILLLCAHSLLLLPQRYVFSSKSQLVLRQSVIFLSCCCYHKGTYFQANHNGYQVRYNEYKLLLLPQRYVFSSKSQQTTGRADKFKRCCCYHKGTYFQANHNRKIKEVLTIVVVVATTKVRIFKQITTYSQHQLNLLALLLLPQRYVFSSKSQRVTFRGTPWNRCCCYHKGTYFQANHNNNILITS